MIKDYVRTLEVIFENPIHHNLLDHQRDHLHKIIKLLTDSYINRIPKPAPNRPLHIKRSMIKRVINEPLTKILLYIMQENGEFVCYRTVKEFLIECELLHHKNKRAILGMAFKSLVNAELIVNSSYGIYELTEKGRNKLV